MPRGGSRNRGPGTPGPDSEKALQRRRGSLVLPRLGYRGPVPDFPLPSGSARELEVWQEAWRSPQAAAWAREPWRHRAVGLWVRMSVRLEQENATAALGNVVVRLADQVGLTPAGLKENLWVVEEPEQPAVASRAGSSPQSSGVSSLERARIRFAGSASRDQDPPPAPDDSG